MRMPRRPGFGTLAIRHAVLLFSLTIPPCFCFVFTSLPFSDSRSGPGLDGVVKLYFSLATHRLAKRRGVGETKDCVTR